MNIYVLNKNFDVVGVVDDYTSVIWTTRYFTKGDFELFLSASKSNIELLQKDYYLVRENDVKSNCYKNVMIIRNIQIQTDEEQGDNLIVTGYCLKSILTRRVIVNQTILNGRVENCIKQLINENIIEPTDTGRAINNFVFGVNSLINTHSMSLQVTGKNLEETISEICNSYGYGYDVYINDNKQFVFYLYEGANRSYSQEENPHVVFSSEFDNLLTSDFISNADNFANVAIVAGEGEGVARKKAVAGNVTGLERFEVFIDSRNSSTNEGAISDSEYNTMLVEEGYEALQEHIVTTSFEGDIDNTLNYTINKDYFLGDLVQVENDYKISAQTRIIEVIESEDENGANIITTFSNMEGV